MGRWFNQYGKTVPKNKKKILGIFIFLSTVFIVSFSSVYILVPYGDILGLVVSPTVDYKFKNIDIASKCIIPQTDPFDPQIMKYIVPPLPLQNPYEPSLMYVDDKGVVHYNSTVLETLHLHRTDITCSYSAIIPNSKDDFSTILPPVMFTPPHRINQDFFKITCTKIKTGLLEMFSDNVVFEKILTNIRDLDRDIGGETTEQLSVLMLGIDSVARAAAVRRLPKAMKYLREELHAYDFKGYMKVGENTLPNVIPMLTGRKYNTSELPIVDLAKDPFDLFPLLWRNFSAKQYATLYTEDFPILSTFNLVKRGFEAPPTDHYQRPYWVELYKVAKSWNYMRQYFGKLTHNLGIEYFKQFIRHYEGKLKFGWTFFNELAHGNPSLLEYGADDVLDFFKWYKSRNCKNCVLIFFSDHGQRLTDIRHTVIGRIETRMPLLQIVIPDHIKAKYPEIHKSLSLNTERLTTAYDIHQTLVDLLNSNFDNPTDLYVNGSVRGMSLLKPLPTERSCKDAGIDEVFCACHQSTTVSTNSSLATNIAVAMVTKINQILSNQPYCVKLTLQVIKDVQNINVGLKMEGKGVDPYAKSDSIPQRHTVVIETIPGNGVFEATYDSTSDTDLGIVGYIQRISAYGTQAECINDTTLRNYCYCKSLTGL